MMHGSVTVGHRQATEELGSLREAIDWIAHTRGEAVFLISPETGEQLTFAGLQARCAAISTRLLQTGLTRADKVAFLLDNGLFAAQLFLGTMYAGLTAVPLNVRAGPSQLSYMLDHCDAKVVFVDNEYNALITEVMANVRTKIEIIRMDLDSWTKPVEPPCSSFNLPLLRAQDPALQIYSSGTTGRPNGAIHTHRSILAHGRNSICAHKLTAADRSLLVLPLYHINAECVTLVPTLMSGGSVVIPRGFIVSEFWNWLDDYRCTWSALVPTIISQLLDWKDPKAESRAAAFRRLRFLRTSSAPLSPALHREFLEKFKLPLIQAMGSSEAGNVFSNPVPPGTNKIGSPGLPWGFDIKVVDRDGDELPVGEAGEVLIRGKGMMVGYYKDPERTAIALDTAGWLHTGDLAYRDEDGYFFVIGRSKELIIKGGMNIAPKQIDEVLESHPAILEAAVVGVPDRYVGEDIVAFAVLRDGMRCDENDLLRFCESHLGYFKTPSQIHFVPDLPKGPSGKVQRLKLQEVAERSVSAAEIDSEDQIPSLYHARAPSSPIERVIAETWAKLLKQPHVDPHSNFFSLGGTSLLAIQCISLLRQALPIRMSLADFFENATVAEQAALIQTRSTLSGVYSAEEQDPSLSFGQPATYQPIPLRDRSLPCPLSPNQERIWFMEQMIAGEPVYNEAEAVRLHGELDVELLERALNAVIARRENLRTSIRAIGDEPSAFVHRSWRLVLKKIDLSLLPTAQREAKVRWLLTEEPRIPYRLEAEPGLRVALLRLRQKEHVLILMMHHIICDWASLGNFWRDLSALYRNGCRGGPLELPPLPIQHGDYAVWQRQMLNCGAFKDDLTYWEENLRGAPALLDLPTDWPRPSVFSYRGAKRRFSIPRKLSRILREFGRLEKVSLFTLFTSAINALLSRYTEQDEIMLGIPIADRERPELQSMIGFLLHTQCLRTQFVANLSFRELLMQVQKSVLELYAHRSPPFDQVVSRVQPARSPSYSPLFQVMFVWRDRENDPSFIGLEGLEAESLLAESRTAKFDLTLFVTNASDGFDIDIEYCVDLFDEARIERMARHLCTLLASAAAHPHRSVKDLSLLSEAEHRKLVDWNQTAVDYPKDLCVHELFERQVGLRPHAIAAEFEGARLTYRELDERANGLARRLERLGAGPGTLVALSVDRSLEMLVGLLGILKSGAAYMPLDPTYPVERLEFMLRDSGALLVLTQERLRDQLKLASPNVQIFCLDADREMAAARRTENPKSAASPGDLAYVIYTSGSTGQPKGVEIAHQNLTNVLCAMARKPGFAPDDKLLAITTMSFDIAALELFLPLISGGQVEIAPASELPDGLALRERLERSGATIMQATPATWAMLVEAGWSGDRNLTVLCGGEAIAPALANALLERANEVWNVYGPTETTIWSSLARIEGGQPITIGSPIANTQFYVVDRSGHPTPVGVPGELLIGGNGVARGYLGRPELTKERFVADLFSGQPGGRLYKTGDLVRRLSNGSVEYLRRLDQQVKIRGFRIELGEIETALAGHRAVREAVVLAREDEPGAKRLVAYLTVAGGVPPKDSELRDLLRAKLPEYMVPHAFMVLDRFPMTPSGKVDRAALPRPDFRSTIPDAFAEPATETEKALAILWGQVLRINHLGLHDNFFDLGGYSLLAARVISKINARFETKLSVGAIFLAPTIESLGLAIEKSLRNADDGRARVYSLRDGRIGPPIYFLGNGAAEHRLAELIDNEHAVFALDLPIASEWRRAIEMHDFEALPTFEELGVRFGDSLRAHAGLTPCVLVGYSFWGKVAFEAARALIDAGGKVAYVLLVDAYATTVYYGGWRNVTKGAIHAVGESENLGAALSTAGRLLRWLLARKEPYFSSNGRSRILLSSPRPPRGSPVGDPQDRRVTEEWVEDEWMRSLGPIIADRFNPRTLEARGVLIRTRLSGEESLPSQHLANGWRDLFAQGLEVIAAPGSHVSMVRDRANRLEVARAIEGTLNRYGVAEAS